MKPLEHALRRGDQPLVVQPRADVAVVGRHVAARVHPAAGLDDVGAQLFLEARAHARPLEVVAALGRSRSSASSPPASTASDGRGDRPRCRTPDRAPASRAPPAARRPSLGRPPKVSITPSTKRQNAHATASSSTRTSRTRITVRPRRRRSRAVGRGGHAFERPAGRLTFRAVGRQIHHLLPLGRGALAGLPCRTRARCPC